MIMHLFTVQMGLNLSFSFWNGIKSVISDMATEQSEYKFNLKFMEHILQKSPK